MDTQPLQRSAAIVAAALVLGGAFVVGATYSGRQANAAAAATPLAVVSPTQPSGAAGAPGTGITVSGTAQVAGTPDTLSLSLSVVTKASTVSKALDQANRATTRVQSALAGRGVAAKDLQTSDLQVQPEYRYPTDGSPVADGYSVTEGLTVLLRNISRAGDAITAATAAGGDAVRVNGISLGLEDTGRLASSARDKAVADARAKAEQYARAVGRSLGPVTALSESITTPPPTDYSMPMASSAKSIPIQPGSQSVGVTVTVTYAFGP